MTAQGQQLGALQGAWRSSKDGKVWRINGTEACGMDHLRSFKLCVRPLGEVPWGNGGIVLDS